MSKKGLFFFFLSIILSLGVWIKLEYGKFVNTLFQVRKGGYYFEISKGATAHSIARGLYDQGLLLTNPLYFYLLTRWKGKTQAIKAGEYYIPSGTTPLSFLEQIVNGKVVQHSFTIIEGWTFTQLINAINNTPYVQHTLIQQGGPTEIMERIGYTSIHPEGRFFPDTYFFSAESTDISILKRAFQLMEKHLASAWDNRASDLPYQNPYEALTMASIVERESALEIERPIISGVLIRRLKKKMRLQTDPTVIYGLGELFTGTLHRLDLKKDTPYNTYTRFGLPITPICMPSLKSLYAALHPDNGDTLYFVARGDGSHQFSTTYEDHKIAIQTYILGKNKQH
ncbi:endolytic transglycosylase MltG [Candidatus Nitrosacidococcus tergens]|uniref:Endolytic murein transglycosylase n=1 Tax=Candidatus Nitrosacidococcus tergens TaxID=553981 RepID=A0A7G1Q9M1_9GAMM|nr:endolytic transglycosylase MltG [Candidatus Nitrosacidococcus tergens]CAB1275924.1 Aminodeoxychorismate lyase [Candidatus Nitrosacidococcus tergens]